MALSKQTQIWLALLSNQMCWYPDCPTVIFSCPVQADNSLYQALAQETLYIMLLNISFSEDAMAC